METLQPMSMLSRLHGVLAPKPAQEVGTRLSTSWTMSSCYYAVRTMSSCYYAVRTISSCYYAVRTMSSCYDAIRTMSSCYDAVRAMSSWLKFEIFLILKLSHIIFHLPWAWTTQFLLWLMLPRSRFFQAHKRGWKYADEWMIRPKSAWSFVRLLLNQWRNRHATHRHAHLSKCSFSHKDLLSREVVHGLWTDRGVPTRFYKPTHL